MCIRDSLVVSAVTASQTVAVAEASAPGLQPGAFFLDFNSASPGAKIRAAGIVNGAGGRYVEGAVMTSVPPHRIRVPLLLGGPDAAALLPQLQGLGFAPRLADERLGIASATKMSRSVMIKGLEALVIESFTTARHYGVEDALIASLRETFPGIDWEKQAAYFFQRVIEHGRRRSEEVQAVSYTHLDVYKRQTEESVRRAMAIQLVINREWGLAKNENPNQGAFVIDELTELVEEAVLSEFERIAERGGVLGAMETGYQRSKIQEESMHYEMLKHTGEYPIVGVNTFRNPHGDPVSENIELARSTDEEKQSQLTRLQAFHDRHAAQAPALLARLQQAVIDNGNVFEVLMDAVRCCSLGQITNALFEVGGQYRRSM